MESQLSARFGKYEADSETSISLVIEMLIKCILSLTDAEMPILKKFEVIYIVPYFLRVQNSLKQYILFVAL